MIWDHSEISIIETKTAELSGWHRDWMAISKKRRHGAPICNLEIGGKVKGKFFLLNSKTVENDLSSIRIREETKTERIKNNIKAVKGEVHFWIMNTNLNEVHPETKQLMGRELYHRIAEIAHSIIEKGPDGVSAEEYALRVGKFDKKDKITNMYIEEIKLIRTKS